MIADTRRVDNRMIPIIQADAAKIGITFTVRRSTARTRRIQTTNKNIPISERPGWGKDYADPYTFFARALRSRTIITTGNTNYSLVGVTPAIAKKSARRGTWTNVPIVDRDIDACSAKLARRPHDLLGEPRQEADDARSSRGSRTSGRTTCSSSARTSRTGTTTSSPTAPRTPRWPSSSSNAIREEGRTRPALHHSTTETEMMLLHRTQTRLDFRRRRRVFSRSRSRSSICSPPATRRCASPARTRPTRSSRRSTTASASTGRGMCSSASSPSTSSPATSTAGRASATRTRAVARPSSLIVERAPRTLLLIAGAASSGS